MTKEHLEALLSAATVSKGSDGWQDVAPGRHLTLYAAVNGVSLTVSRVTAVRVGAGLLHTRTQRGEVYVLSLADLFAGAIDEPAEQGRKAGFV